MWKQRPQKMNKKFGGQILKQISVFGREIFVRPKLKYGRDRTADTGGRLWSTTPSKVWSWVLVHWATAISKTSFTNKSG